MPPRLDPEIEALINSDSEPGINSAGEAAGQDAIEFGSDANSALGAIGGGLMNALGSAPGQIAAMANLPGVVGDALQDPSQTFGALVNRSGPQLGADLIGLGAMAIPNPAASGLVSGAARGLANAYEMPEGTPFNDRLEQFTTDAMSPFALPVIGEVPSGIKKGAGKILGETVEQAALPDRLATSLIFRRSKRLDRGKISQGVLEFQENEIVRQLRKDGVLDTPKIPAMINRYYANLDMREAQIESIMNKGVGPNGESLGASPAAGVKRVMLTTPNGIQTRVEFPKAEKFIEESMATPSTRQAMEAQLDELRKVIDGYDLPDGRRIDGVETIADLQKAKRTAYRDNQAMYQKLGLNPENIPDEFDQLTRKAVGDIVDMLNDSISTAAGRYGTEAQGLASKFAPINKEWSVYLDALKDFRRLADTSTDMAKSLIGVRQGLGIGGGVGADLMLGTPGLFTGAGAMLTTPQGLGAAQFGAQKLTDLGEFASPVAGPVINAGKAVMSDPRTMGAVASFDQIINGGGQQAYAQSFLPRTPEGVKANPVAVLQALPPEMHGQFQQALEGGNDEINRFMSQALMTVPGLAQKFAPSKISPEEFGGQFQDPMTTYGLYQEVTSQMLRGDMDPRKAYRAQKDVVQGKVPRAMQ